MSSSNFQFDPMIPQVTDKLAQSQKDMLINFQTLSLAFGENHINFYSSAQTNEAEQGKHTNIQMLKGPSFQTKIGETNIYCKQVKDGDFYPPQLFFKMQNNGQEQQYTTFQNTDPVKSNSTYTFIPGGFLFYFGMAKIVQPGNFATITLTPNPTKVIFAMANQIPQIFNSATLNFGNYMAVSRNKNVVTFTWRAPGTGLSTAPNVPAFLYYAIGAIY